MQMQVDIMGSKSGHDELKYDHSNPDEVSKTAKQILDKIRLGWALYGGKKGGELIRLIDKKTIQKAPDKMKYIEKVMAENDSIMLSEIESMLKDEQYEKKLVANPQTGG